MFLQGQPPMRGIIPPHLCDPCAGSLPATLPALSLSAHYRRLWDTRWTCVLLSASSGSDSAGCVPVGPCTVWPWVSPALPLLSSLLASLQSTHLPRFALREPWAWAIGLSAIFYPTVGKSTESFLFHPGDEPQRLGSSSQLKLTSKWLSNFRHGVIG